MSVSQCREVGRDGRRQLLALTQIAQLRADAEDVARDQLTGLGLVPRGVLRLPRSGAIGLRQVLLEALTNLVPALTGRGLAIGADLLALEDPDPVAVPAAQVDPAVVAGRPAPQIGMIRQQELSHQPFEAATDVVGAQLGVDRGWLEARDRQHRGSPSQTFGPRASGPAPIFSTAG